MRATGIVAAPAAPTPLKPPRAYRFVLPLAGALALAAGGWFAFSRPDTGANSLRPRSASELHAELLAHGVDAPTVEGLLSAEDAVRAFAQKTAGSVQGDAARARAVLAALRMRADAQAFVPWSLGEPRNGPLLVPNDLLPVLERDGGRAHFYPLELAAFAVATLRALEVPAMVAELIAVQGETAPLDPSGYFGYFVVAVASGASAPLLLDPYGGRTLDSATRHALLADLTVLGAGLSHDALYQTAFLADTQRALRASSHALVLAPQLPSVRSTRGVVVLSARMIEQALQELEAARQLRPDAPRQHNVASAYLLLGEVVRAEPLLSRALSEAPDFAPARVTLSGVLGAQGDVAGAERELARAAELSSDLSMVQFALAERELLRGERDEAVARARRAVAERPAFDAQLRLGVVLRQAGRYEDMRQVANALLTLAPGYRKDEVRELILSALGSSALDPVLPSEPDVSAADLEDLGADVTKGALDRTGGGPNGNATDANTLRLASPRKSQLGLGADVPKLRLGQSE